MNKKKICFVSGRFGDVDGVSLETDKWADVLKKLGHEVYYCAGEFPMEVPNSICIKEMGFSDSGALSILERSFNCQTDVDKLKGDIEEQAEIIFKKLIQMIDQYEFDVIVPQNMFAIPMQLPLSLALEKVVLGTSIPMVSHNHDFFWERERYNNSNIQDILERIFPVIHPSVKHVVINSAAKRSLMYRKEEKSVVVPNVMDYTHRFAFKDNYNKSFRKDLGIDQDDILILQPTRIVARKGIEIALELIYKLDDSRIKFLISGYSGDEGHDYQKFLEEKVEEYSIGDKVIWGHEKIQYLRSEKNGQKIYNLSDAYAYSDFITYPSTYEGFGNAFLETILAKKPFLVNNYKPVFDQDIKPLGFKGVVIEDGVLTDSAVNEVRKVLDNPKMVSEMVEHNFMLANDHFSYDVLEKLLRDIF